MRKVYSSSVKSCVLHGSKTWFVRKENEVALAHAETRMVRWMCGVCQTGRYSSVAPRDGLGLEEDIIFSCYDNR